MKLGYTLHSIISGKKNLPIHSVEAFKSEDHSDLLKLGAIRAPTEDELKLYEMTHPSGRPADKGADEASVAAQKAAAKKAAEEAEKKAAAEAAEKAAAQVAEQTPSEPSADPDEQDEALL